MIKSRLTTENFLEKAFYIHGKKYNYDKTKYVKSKEKVIITCSVHGDFKQLPNAHLNGQGCYKCSIDKLSNINYKNSFVNKCIIKANSIHNYKYDYSLITADTYYGMTVKHPIICPIHGLFYQTLNQHVSNKKGCRKCATKNRKITKCFGWTFSNWKEKCKNKIPKLYIVRLFDNNESFIKIGITQQDTIQKRFSNKHGYSLEILSVVTGTPKFIWDLEHKILKLLKPNKYIPLKEFEGRHECLVDDTKLILNTLNKLQWQQ